MKKSSNVIRWIGVAIFAMMSVYALSEGGFIGALLFLLGGAAIAPLNIISKLRSKLKLNKALTIVLAVVLLFAGSLATPTSEVPVDSNNSSQIPPLKQMIHRIKLLHPTKNKAVPKHQAKIKLVLQTLPLQAAKPKNLQIALARVRQRL